jgi:hypothetical protein
VTGVKVGARRGDDGAGGGIGSRHGDGASGDAAMSSTSLSSPTAL